MSRLKTILLACMVAGCSAPAFAGVLATDGSTYLGVWHGSTPYQGLDLFNQPTDLIGYVDWAVYAPGTFPVAFFPDVVIPADEFVYAYQAFETGADPLSSVQIDLANEANNIGTFFGGGVAGDPTIFNIIIPNDVAEWLFDGVPQGGSTRGLLFTSPNVPMFATGTTIDGGSAAAVVPVPSPDSFPIPEPASLTLAICGVAGLAIQWVRRRSRKVQA